MQFIRLQMMLQHSERAAKADKAAFDLYNRGKISIEECITMFCDNNLHSGEESRIDPMTFALWVESLGYIKQRAKREREARKKWESSSL